VPAAGGPERGPLERLERKSTTETLWLYVIAALALEGPTYAYNVRRIIAKYFGFKPSTITLYTVIYRLERGGFLRRRDNLYEVTPKGMDLLREGVKRLEERVQKLREALSKATGGGSR